MSTWAKVADALHEIGTNDYPRPFRPMFGRLISDRKFLATFYTLPASAALLAELAAARLDVNWSDPEAFTDLRIADLACGTGALLASAYRAVAARHPQGRRRRREVSPLNDGAGAYRRRHHARSDASHSLNLVQRTSRTTV